MSTVKISQLPFITQLNANTEKTLIAGVDLVSGLTGKISVRTYNLTINNKINSIKFNCKNKMLNII